MHITINNQPAALKKGTSFEYVSENRLFSGSDGYTLSITFPLSECPENLAIFGHINRADVAARKVIFDCEIQDGVFCKAGSITITEISETEVKTQFLEGRSEQNFNKTFDKVYVNELDIGEPETVNKSARTPMQAWQPDLANPVAVALPWVNDYSGNIQNQAECIIDNEAQNRFHYVWNKDTAGLSWQPYLIHITKKICEAVGYSHDFTAWEQAEGFKYLLICNTLPFAWYMPEYANALPHWSVQEYFEKLELLLGGEFDFDHRRKIISFNFTQQALAALPPVELRDVVEAHSTEVKVDDMQCDYMECKNLAYKDCSHEMWKFYSCDWFIKGWQSRLVRYDTLSALIADCKSFHKWDGLHTRNGKIDKLLYAADVDTYFIVRPMERYKNVIDFEQKKIFRYMYFCRLQPVNMFGARINDPDEDADQEEIEFVPAWIDDTEAKYGKLLFLSFGSYNDTTLAEDQDEDENSKFQNTNSLSSLVAGEESKASEYYDKIYVAFWDGSFFTMGKLPYPRVEDVEIADDWSSYDIRHFSLRLNGKRATRSFLQKIEPSQKTTFKFLADSIPDVRSIFHIRGKRYICEKLTATFTENGMSQLIKGVFYPISNEP